MLMLAFLGKRANAFSIKVTSTSPDAKSSDAYEYNNIPTRF